MKDQLGRAYNRTTHLEERKRMMQTWADYLDGLKAGEMDGQKELVPFCFHDLRHAYVSLAVMSGEIDIATLSQLLDRS